MWQVVEAEAAAHDVFLDFADAQRHTAFERPFVELDHLGLIPTIPIQQHANHRIVLIIVLAQATSRAHLGDGRLETRVLPLDL